MDSFRQRMLRPRDIIDREVTMEAGTTEAATGADASEPLSARERDDPRYQAARAAGQGEKGREMLEHVRQGAELNGSEEMSALDWLLGTPKPIVHRIDVDLETDTGMRKLTFISRRIDPRKIDGIELRNVQQSTGRIDRITADAEIIVESCEWLQDGRRKVRIQSDEFCTMPVRNRETDDIETIRIASAATALERRFVGQEGLLTLVAAEIRRLGGYDPQRLGTSQRQLVESSLG